VDLVDLEVQAVLVVPEVQADPEVLVELVDLEVQEDLAAQADMAAEAAEAVVVVTLLLKVLLLLIMEVVVAVELVFQLVMEAIQNHQLVTVKALVQLFLLKPLVHPDQQMPAVVVQHGRAVELEVLEVT